MKGQAIVVGAGILGRCVALELTRRNWRVLLTDRGAADGQGSASRAAAGMLAPHSELEMGDFRISGLGEKSLGIWPMILEGLEEKVFFRCAGTLMIAPSEGHSDLKRIARRAAGKSVVWMNRRELRDLEPEIDPRFAAGLLFSAEGQIETRELLPAMAGALERRGARLFFGVEVEDIESGGVTWGDRRHSADFVIDCRGLGARDDLRKLRGVRGELYRLEAPGVRLNRTIRVCSQRNSFYVVPRRYPMYLVGATEIESDDPGPISVRSSLEILNAAFAVHGGFDEARVIEAVTGCRPALPNNLPSIKREGGLLRINGLYRHGCLISPRLAQIIVDCIEGKMLDESESYLFEEAKCF